MEPAPPAPLDLASHRESQGITLEQLMEETKLSRRFLQAIEEGNYGELPGGIFTISYLRQYAGATSYNVNRLLGHYHETVGLPALVPDGARPEPRIGWLRIFGD